MGVIALVESIETLQSLGMDRIEDYERELTAYSLEKIANNIDYYNNKYSNPPLD